MKNLSTIPRMQRLLVATLLFSLISAPSFAQTVLFRDDFNGAMQSGWAWTRENPATWSLTPTGLQIELEYGDLWQNWTNNCRNMLLRPAPSSDFIIEAKLDVSLVAPINQAHILLYYNDDHYVRFGPVLSYGYQVVIDVVHEVGGGIAHQSAVFWGSNLLYLKIQKSGSSANCYYSSDGQNWLLHHTISDLNFSVVQVGLVAFDGSEPPSSSVATYDYFQISEPAPPQCVNPPSGITRWWKAENNANDNIGTNHGAMQNGATFAAGKVGQAFSFDGVDDYVSLPPNSGTGDFTIDFWEKSSSNALYKVALSFAASASPTTSNLIFDFNDPDIPGGVGLWVYWNGGGEYRITTGSIGSFTNGLWHHIALTRSGANMTLYVNGASVGSTVYAPVINLSNFDVNYIGASPATPPANFWQGAVDEVSIYNRALTASEIQSLYDAGSAGKCTAPANLALNKPATASSSSSGYPPSNAVDGNAGKHWRSGNLSSSTKAWWRVDLGATYNLNNVVINWRTGFYAKKYKVQVSLTGSGWTTVHTDNAGNGGTDNVTFTATAARYVRIHMSQHNKTTERINEVQVFAAPSALAKNVDGSEEEVAEAVAAAVTSYQLEQNYPNPFNPTTVISFQLPVNSAVKLMIYSLTGQLVRELVNGEMNAGRHAISWDGRDRIGNTVAAGMYLYRLVAYGVNGEVVFTQTRRMAFVK